MQDRDRGCRLFLVEGGEEVGLEGANVGERVGDLGVGEGDDEGFLDGIPGGRGIF